MLAVWPVESISSEKAPGFQNPSDFPFPKRGAVPLTPTLSREGPGRSGVVFGRMLPCGFDKCGHKVKKI